MGNQNKPNPFFEIGLCLMDIALLLDDEHLKKCEPYLKRIENAVIGLAKEKGEFKNEE